jgi:hypothetical protein
MTDTTNPPPGRRRSGLLPLLLIVGALALLLYLYLRSTAPPAAPAPEPTVTAMVELATSTPVPPEPPEPPAKTPTPRPIDSGADPVCQDYLVAVGPDPATLSVDPICVGASNRVVWRSWDGQSPLKIYFPTSGFPKGVSPDVAPFLQMRRDRNPATGKDDWVFIYPGKASTQSGPPNERFGRPGRRYKLKYDQELNGKRVDGHIIIQK